LELCLSSASAAAALGFIVAFHFQEPPAHAPVVSHAPSRMNNQLT
jgi:hypothetical protein